jgi:hypothetical protein
MAIAGTCGWLVTMGLKLCQSNIMSFLIPSLGRARVRYERKGREGFIERLL